MSNIHEQEKPPITPEVVTIGQEFQLFAPERTNIARYNLEPYPVWREKIATWKSRGESAELLHFESAIHLDLENGLPHIPLNVSTAAESDLALDSLTPADRRYGYIITPNDYDPEKRAQKREAWKRRFGDRRVDDFKLHSYAYLWQDAEALSDSGLSFNTGEEDFYFEDVYEFYPEVDAMLQKLRLIIRSDTDSFMGEFWQPQFDAGYLRTSEFYPLDSGPLAPDMHGETGLRLYFPQEREVFEELLGKFVIAQPPPRPKSPRLKIVAGGKIKDMPLPERQ